MPVLKNSKREAFAQALARGLPIRAAYVEAGYMDHKSNAISLSRTSIVQARVHELRPDLPVVIDPTPLKTLSHAIEAHSRQMAQTEAALLPAEGPATVERLLKELELARTLAMAEGQTRAAIAATMEKAKLQGFNDGRRQPDVPENAFQSIDLSHLTDVQLATLEAIFGPLAIAGSGDGDDRDGEDAES
jgi:hypothetical protein